MDISNKFGLFLFVYCLTTGIGLLINPKGFLMAIEDLLNSPGQKLIVGFIALIFGITLIIFHPYYSYGWPVMITIFGWLSLIKGMLYLYNDVAINVFASIYKTEKSIYIAGIITLVFATYFGYYAIICYTNTI